MSETPQARRIREAVEAAIRRRDRYSDARVKELLRALDRAAGDVAGQVRRFGEKASLQPWQRTRVAILNDLGRELDRMAAELRDTWKAGVRGNVEGALRLGIEDGLGQLEAMKAPDFQDLTDASRNALVTRTLSTIDRAAVDFLANYQVKLLGSVSTELSANIQNAVAQGLLTGKSIPEVARDIGGVVEDKEAFRRAGKTVFKTAQKRATLIARTETLRAHNEGRVAFYKAVGVEKVQWVTAEDERTCPECAPLDGKIFPIDDVPQAPHPGCRCSRVAVVE